MATVKGYNIDEARQLAEVFTNRFKGGMCHFAVQQPCVVTISLKGGGYKSKRFIGEEVLIGSGAYVGKTGKLILTFIGDSLAAGERAEIELTKALNGILGRDFREFADTTIAELDSRYMGDVRFGVDEMETTASADATRDRYKEDPLFGSW